MLRKILIGMMLAINLMGFTQAQAQSLEPVSIEATSSMEITLKIKDVTYSNGWYYIETEQDNEGGTWVLDLSKGKYSNNRKRIYRKLFVGKTVTVQFDSNYELISWMLNM